jgi:hypothetical protein
MRTNFVVALVFIAYTAPAVATPCATALCPSPGPIPGAGLLSYVALGLVGLGVASWKKWRR